MSITISLLPVSLSLIHIPRSKIQDLSYPILHQLLLPNPTFLNITCNSIELSLFAQESSSKLFRVNSSDSNKEGEVEISKERWSVLQIDSHSGSDEARARASELSAPLADAGISIMYQSSYTSDFIFVQQQRLQEAMSLFASAGFDLYNTENTTTSHSPTSPVDVFTRSRSSTDSSSRLPSSVFAAAAGGMSKAHSPTSSEVTVLDTDLICVGLSDENVEEWMLKVLKLIMFPSLVVPSSADESSASCPKGGGLEESIIVLSNDPAISTSRAHSPIIWTNDESSGSEQEEEQEDEPNRSTSSLVTSLAPSIPPTDATEEKTIPFFSFTRTPEGSSLTTDVTVLASLFTQSERHMLMCGDELAAIDCPSPSPVQEGEGQEEEEEGGTMKCLEIDLRKFGLEKHGLVNRFSRVLEQASINHMYSSTFKTANVLVNKKHALRAQALLREC